MLIDQKNTINGSFISYNNIEVFKPSGAINSLTCTELQYQMIAIIQTRPDYLVIDLKDISFIDVRGLSLLLRMRQAMENIGGKLLLGNINSQVAMLLEVSDCDRLFGSYDSILLVEAN